MDLIFTTTQTTTTTPAPVIYGSLLDNDLTVPYDNTHGIASIVARDVALSLFFMMASYKGRPTNPDALFECDFEDGWCPGFVPEDHSDIPWLLHKGSTPSNDTGPDHDHTRFNEYGTYVFIEASKRRIAETAVFTTPPVMMLDKPKYCLRFWYNMYGAGTGSLWIYWNAAGAENIHTVVDKHSGEKSKDGSDWKESQTTLHSTALNKHYRPVVFEFRAIRGVSYKSDIAVDDIVLVPGECAEVPRSKTATTMTFKGITTAPTRSTTPSWKVADPSWERCGDDFYHIKREMCCNDHPRKKSSKHHRCCGSKTFHVIYNVCCGGGVFSVNTHGCCASRYSYKKTEKGCCAGQMTFTHATHECKHGSIVKRKKSKGKPRGKRSILTEFWQYLWPSM